MKCENPKISSHPSPIIDRGEDNETEIRVKKDECIKYLFLPSSDGTYSRKFIVEQNALLFASVIALGANMDIKISVFFEGSKSGANVRILGLAQNHAIQNLSGIGKVPLGNRDIQLRIDQTNILLGSGAKIRGVPILEVATDSILGGHSCRVHRISDEALFYLQSHGLSRKTAEGLLLEAEIGKHVTVMEEKSSAVKGEILSRLGLSGEL